MTSLETQKVVNFHDGQEINCIEDILTFDTLNEMHDGK